ncbi:MAG: DUF4430 domain-containing protein, partial [Anaerovoracaceae bacterium]
EEEKKKAEEEAKKAAALKKKSEEKKKSTAEAVKYCYVTVTCKNLLSERDDAPANIRSSIPKSGVIMSKSKIEIKSGDTVYSATKRAVDAGGIAFVKTGSGGNTYVEGINNIFEKDFGAMSGWKYTVNGVYKDKSSGSVKLKKDDNIAWGYTLDGGSAF